MSFSGLLTLPADGVHLFTRRIPEADVCERHALSSDEASTFLMTHHSNEERWIAFYQAGEVGRLKVSPVGRTLHYIG